MDKVQRKIQTPIGSLFLVASTKGLMGIYWTTRNLPTSKTHKILDKAEPQIKEYLSGSRRNFSIPLILEGTEFQKKVWSELLKIPFGKTVSYKDIAQALKNPGASRAVGTANRQNPICIIIPCHRVINENGELGGYSGGLRVKKFLLSLEKSQPALIKK